MVLAAWKAQQRLRREADARGGAARMQRRLKRETRRWLDRIGDGGIERWLSRPGAGSWWFDGPALEWAGRAYTGADRARAEEAAAGEIALLGSRTVPGSPLQWRRDLYSGIEWPLDPCWRLQIVRGDGSDIRTVWELSRCYHFLQLARAWAASSDARWADVFRAHVESFRAQNPVGLGPHWASPMDVAIRAANWALVAPAFASTPLPADFWAAYLADLHVAGLWIERHLEWHPVHRGNHYVANLVGLAYLGTLFRGTADGDRWLRLAGRELPQELHYQVLPDGVAFEGSIGYHRLHTELFAFGGDLLRRNLPGLDLVEYDAALGRMVAFIAVCTQPDGRAPMLGDADDGRLHTLWADALHDPRVHGMGLPPRWTPAPAGDGEFSYPHSGFHVLRHDRDHAIIRCGPVGLQGAGSHDHNDQLSFELVIDGVRVVSDSGTYAYTRDLDARYAFRSTVAHSVVQVGCEEQNPIAVERPWRVGEDRTRSRVLHCVRRGSLLSFAAEHRGYAHRPSSAVCRRTLTRETDGGWLILDEVTGAGSEPITWRLHLEPGTVTQTEAGRFTVELADGTFNVELDAPASLTAAISSGERSNAYGTREQRPVLVLDGTADLPLRIACRIRRI